MTSLIALLITILMFSIVICLVLYIIGQLPMPHYWKNILSMAVAFVILIFFLQHMDEMTAILGLGFRHH